MASSESEKEPYENREELSRGKQALGLSRNYVPTWTSKDAFREFFQNWMDGMVVANNITQRNIQVVIKESNDEYTAMAYRCDVDGKRAQPDKLLGFIRYQSKKGSLELTNFNARLPRTALEMGESSKSQMENMAGAHGEGFKVAALVVVRKGYQVKFEASSYNWTFKFGGRGKRQLYCHLSPVKPETVKRDLAAYISKLTRGDSRQLKANVWEDVTVKIGQLYGSKSQKIAEAKFRDWINVALALDRPSKFIQTAGGELILERRTEEDYNFSEGSINRDREMLSNENQMAKVLASIWGEAIRNQEADFVQEYTDMLLEEKRNDVRLVKDHLSKQTANAVWRQLIKMDGEKSFYYDRDNGATARDVNVIRQNLRKQPVSLPRSIWEPLRRFGLVRTPEDQRNHLLRNSEIASIEQHVYSRGIVRALRSILALDPRTKDLNLVFKKGGTAGLDLILDKSDVLIHEKWIDFLKSHEDAPCRLSQLVERKGVQVEGFSCSHIVMELYKIILQELSKGQSIEQTKISRRLCLKASEGLLQMPDKIELTAAGIPSGQLKVSWKDLQGHANLLNYSIDQKCRVILHRESTCSSRKNDLLTPNGEILLPQPTSQEQRATCGCQTMVAVSQGHCYVVFSGLDLNELYFPMVSRTEPQSFYGLPPKPMKPSSLKPKLRPSPAAKKVEKVALTAEELQQLLNKANATLRMKEKQLESSEQALKLKEQQLDAALQDVDAKKQQLNTTSESLRTTQQELRKNVATGEAQQRQLTSRVEDLQNEVHQLKESKAEIDAESKKLANDVEALHTQNLELQDALTNAAYDPSRSSSQAILASQENQDMRRENSRLRNANRILSDDITQARADQATMTSTLQGVYDMIQGVRTMGTISAVQSTLQGVMSMIQSVLNLEQRATASQGSSVLVKRERVKEENENENENELYEASPPRSSKRAKKAESSRMIEQ